MEITMHPVENGAQISDHAFLRPREIELEIGWDGSTNPGDAFNQLKQLQAARVPFTVYTDRDVIDNMLVAGIATVTDQRTAYSFLAIVRCRQVNLVSTQSTVVSPRQATSGPPLTGIAGAAAAGTGGDFSSRSGNSPFNGIAGSVDQGTKTLKPGSAANLQDPHLQQTFGAAGVQGLPGSPSGPSP